MPCATLRVDGVRGQGVRVLDPLENTNLHSKIIENMLWTPPPRQTYISLPLHRKQKSGSARYNTLTDTSLPHYVFVLDRSHFIVHLRIYN